MLIQFEIKQFGHYAKQALPSLKPSNTQLALLAISAIVAFSSVNEVSAQSRDVAGDTIYATGIFQTLNEENNNFIEGVNLHVWSHTVPMGNQHVSRNYVTDGNGVAAYNDPGIEVYIDSTTGVESYFQSNTTIFPNPGSGINVSLPEKKEGIFSQYSTSGQLIGIQKFNSDEIYADVSAQPAGAITYRIETNDGEVIQGVYIKQNVPAKQISINKEFGSINFKGSPTFHSANYWVVWNHPEFEKDSIEVEFQEGNNSPTNIFMTPINGAIPQTQDLVGIVKDDENNNAPMAGVTAIFYDETNGNTYTETTGSDGKFVFENIPANIIGWTSVGGVDTHYSFNDQTSNTLPTIEIMSDTIAEILDVVMYKKQAAITNLNILIQQTRQGALEETRYYWFDPNLPSSEQATYNGQMAQYDAIMGSYTHVQTMDEDQAHIKIFHGTYNTTPIGDSLIETPLENYQPTTLANVFLNTSGDFGDFSHEIGQADGRGQCGGTGYLSASPPPTGPDAQDVSIDELEVKHWLFNVYTNGETYFNLNNISETLDSKSPEFSKPNSTESNFEYNYMSK